MIVERIELLDFRNYREARLELQAGVTAVLGDNGQGKTNLAEALVYLSTLDSFRGAPTEAMVREGADVAVIRATVREDDGREVLIEAEISRMGRNRTMVNRQRLRHQRELLGVLRSSVFSPDDLAIVKGGPGERRRLLDTALVTLATKNDALRLELDRILRQRNSLLKQVGGPGRRLDEDAAATLDVWDQRFAEVGERLGHARAVLVDRTGPLVAEAYGRLADASVPIAMSYEPSWRATGLLAALASARDDDLRRQMSTVGPHRDELELAVNGLPARTHASQGEQRTLVLALRLGIHHLVTERTGSAPLLILDDVLSELDPDRCRALLGLLPPGQVLITSASPLPEAARPDRVLTVSAGGFAGAPD